jgi:hypothetical protein
MPETIRFFAEGIAALDDESRHDPVKGRAVVKLHFYEIDEVFDVPRSILGIKTNLDLAELRRDRHTGIDFFELHYRESNRGTLRAARGREWMPASAMAIPHDLRGPWPTKVTTYQVGRGRLSLDRSSTKEPRRSTLYRRLSLVKPASPTVPRSKA